jgi:FKBP-type peptidyl-prolyl cis-trans isomerase FkpA
MGPNFMRLLTIIGLFLLSCGPKEQEKKDLLKNIDPEAIKKQFVQANKQIVQKENDEMDYYASAHQMNFVKTAAGIRYFVYKPSAKGDSLKDTSLVVLAYKVFLLNGTECYNSEKDGKKTFVVGHADIESGIVKALHYLKRGDKALILIPSHLAHGLMGDQKKIPPQMPIVYDIEVN